MSLAAPEMKIGWHFLGHATVSQGKRKNIHSSTNVVECLSIVRNLAIKSKIGEGDCGLKYSNV